MEANINLVSCWQEKPEKPFSWKRVFQTKAGKPKTLSTPFIIGTQCKGICIGDICIKSLLFTTDLALIENSDADAILAVYPFAPSPRIIKSLIDFSEKPIICGVGGGLTQGKTALEMAQQAEQLGAKAVIVNQPFKNKHIEQIKKRITIPLISSVSVADFSFKDRVNAGADIFHVTGGANTSQIVEHINYAAPGYPVMATGGKSMESIQYSIRSGADAIVLTPPSSGELFRSIMNQYRKGLNNVN